MSHLTQLTLLTAAVFTGDYLNLLRFIIYHSGICNLQKILNSMCCLQYRYCLHIVLRVELPNLIDLLLLCF